MITRIPRSILRVDPIVPWNDLNTYSYDSSSFSYGAKETNPRSTYIRPDGLKMYVTGQDSDNVHQYGLSIAWQPSSASYEKSFYVGSQDGGPDAVFFNQTGTKMYMAGQYSDAVHQYTLSVPWEIDSATYDSISFYAGTWCANPEGIFIPSDGNKIFIIGGACVHGTMTTPWDISTCTYTKHVAIGGSGVAFHPSGTRMITIEHGGDSAHQYSLSTSWDIDTAVNDNKDLSVVGQDDVPRDIFFKPDGSKMFVTGYRGQSIYQYSPNL